jgi:ribosomal 50S subunit-recycling heat shock protein
MVSEIGVSEYGKTLFDIGHPVGMKMLSEHVFKDYIVVDSNVSSNISSANTSGIAGTNVTAYSFYTTNKATINGSTAANVAAGDIIKISSLQNKVVLSVSNTTVYPTLTFDFINDSYEVLANNSTVVTLESNTAFIGDGRITTVLNSNTLTVSGNTGLVSNTVRVGDFVRLNLSSNVYTTNVISVTANTFQVDAVQTTFSNANNIVYQMFPTFTETSYQIIKSIS